MPAKRPVTTKRGQYHKERSFRINLVKDASLEKINSNILRNRPEMFEKKKVTFEKRNADPSYFTETLCKEFPSLQGNEFSLWRLGCTNVKNDTKISLIPLPSEINNAVALCNCEELNRSCLYIKLQAAPSLLPVPPPQPQSSDSADECDSNSSLSSSSKITSTAPDLLPTEPDLCRPSSPPFPTDRQSFIRQIITLVEPSRSSDEHQLQSSVTRPWVTVSASDINQPLLLPLDTSVSSSQDQFATQYFPSRTNQLLDMTSKVQESSNRDTESRLPKKRRFLLDGANNLEPTAYTDVNMSQDDDTDVPEEMNQNKNSQFISLGLLPNSDTGIFPNVDGQQLTAFSYTALLGDLDSAQQTRTIDINSSHQIYLSPSDFLALQNNANDASNLQGTSGPNNGYENLSTARSLPSLLYNASCASGLQESAQQWSATNLISTNAQTSWDHNQPIQTNDGLRTDLSETNNTDVDNVTQAESMTNLIIKNMEFLVDRMDPDFGLLDIMIASKDLTMAEFHQIRSQPSTIEDRNRKLLQYIINKNKADNFTAALEKARQIHLVNYMNSDGEFTEEYREYWPLLESELEKLIENRQALIDGLDPSLLIFKVFFKDVINKRQHEFILSKSTNSEKNEVLLEMLRRGSIKQYNQTIESLRELNQDRILNILQEIGEEPMQLTMQQYTTEKEELAKQPAPERKKKKLPHSNSKANPVPAPSCDDVPEKYKLEPGLVGTIRIRAEDEKAKWIRGMTILNDELFVVTECSSEIEVYDSVNFSFRRQFNLEQLISPADIVSCNRYKRLYISDIKQTGDQLAEILSIDPHGNLILSWSTGHDWVFGLSVTNESNIILAVCKQNALKEYSPDGQLIHEIDLLEHADIRQPLHAVKLTNGDFLVSHGVKRSYPHRVCVVDADGNLKKSFGRKAGCIFEQMNEPRSLAIDGNGFVMVADCLNGRVLLLNSDLEFKGCIFSKDRKHGLSFPWRILLDESNARLFVDDSFYTNHGRISIFEFS